MKHNAVGHWQVSPSKPLCKPHLLSFLILGSSRCFALVIAVLRCVSKEWFTSILETHADDHIPSSTHFLMFGNDGWPSLNDTFGVKREG